MTKGATRRWKSWTDDELDEYLMIRNALAELFMDVELSEDVKSKLGSLVLRMDLLSDGASMLRWVYMEDIKKLPATTLELHLGKLEEE